MPTSTHKFLSEQAWEEFNAKLEEWTIANTTNPSTSDDTLKLIIAHMNSLATTAYTCVSNDNKYVCEVEKLLFGTLFENLTKEDVASIEVSGRDIGGFLPKNWFNNVTSLTAPMSIKEWIIANGNTELIILLIGKILSELSLEKGLSFFQENIALIRAKLSPNSLGYILSKLPIEAYKEFIDLLGGNIFLKGLIKNSGDLGEVLSKLPTEAYKEFIDLLGGKIFLLDHLIKNSGDLGEVLSKLPTEAYKKFIDLLGGKIFLLDHLIRNPDDLGEVLSKLPTEAYKEFIDLLGGNIFLKGLIKNSGDLGEVLSKLPTEAYKKFIDLLGGEIFWLLEHYLIRNAGDLGEVLSKLPIEAYKKFIDLLGGKNFLLNYLIRNAGNLGEVLSKLPIEAYKLFIDFLVVDNQRILLGPKEDNHNHFDPFLKALTKKSIIKYPYIKDLGTALSKLPLDIEAYKQFIDLLGGKQFLIKTITEHSGSLQEFLSTLTNNNEEAFLFFIKNILGKDYFVQEVNARRLGYILNELPLTYPYQKRELYFKLFIDFLSDGKGFAALIKDANDLYECLRTTTDYDLRVLIMDTLDEDYIKNLITTTKDIDQLTSTLPCFSQAYPLTNGQLRYHNKITGIIFNIEFLQKKIKRAYELGEMTAIILNIPTTDHSLVNSIDFKSLMADKIKNIYDLISFLNGFNHQMTVSSSRIALSELQKVLIFLDIVKPLITTIDGFLEFYKKSFSADITLQLIHFLPKEFFIEKIKNSTDFGDFLGKLLLNTEDYSSGYKIYKELINLLGKDFFATKITTPEDLGCVLGYSLAALDPHTCSRMLNDQARDDVITKCFARSKISNLHDLNQFINAVLSSATQLPAGTKMHTRQNIINFIKHLDLGIITKFKFIAFVHIKLLAANFKSFIGAKLPPRSLSSFNSTTASSVATEETVATGLPLPSAEGQSPSSLTSIEHARLLSFFNPTTASSVATEETVAAGLPLPSAEVQSPSSSRHGLFSR